ncbi:MAG: DUF4116 domain-containing protein [Pseudomonadota bacterium]|nr:DUF4116 domain-containing protein [Pseudomonadota bacterium]
MPKTLDAQPQGEPTANNTEAPDYFELLPDEVLLNIFMNLGHKSLVGLHATCNRLRGLIKDNKLWEKYFFSEGRGEARVSPVGIYPVFQNNSLGGYMCEVAAPPISAGKAVLTFVSPSVLVVRLPAPSPQSTRSELPNLQVYRKLTSYYALAKTSYNTATLLGSQSEMFLDSLNFFQVLKLVVNGKIHAENLPSKYKDDKEIMLAAVYKFPYALQYASDRLRDDEEVVLHAVSRCGEAIRYASERLKQGSTKIAVLAIEKLGSCAEYYLTREIRQHEDVLRALYASNGKLKGKLWCMLRPVAKALKNKKDFILFAVSMNGFEYQFASDVLRADPDVIGTAVAQNYAVLKHVKLCRRTEDIMLPAIKDNASALHYAPDRLKKDIGFVGRALEKNPDVASFYPQNTIQGALLTLTGSGQRRGPGL